MTVWMPCTVLRLVPDRVFRESHPAFSMFVLLGGIFVSTTPFLLLGVPSQATCVGRGLLPHLGFSLILGYGGADTLLQSHVNLKCCSTHAQLAASLPCNPHVWCSAILVKVYWRKRVWHADRNGIVGDFALTARRLVRPEMFLVLVEVGIQVAIIILAPVSAREGLCIIPHGNAMPLYMYFAPIGFKASALGGGTETHTARVSAKRDDNRC